MGLFDALDISASGLIAERTRMDVTSQNLANAQSSEAATSARTSSCASRAAASPTCSAEAIGAAAAPAGGVEVAGVSTDQAQQRRVYDPGHPDADAQGYVRLPNVNAVSEMTDLISASRAYEANVTAMNTAKQMFSKTLELLR